MDLYKTNCPNCHKLLIRELFDVNHKNLYFCPFCGYYNSSKEKGFNKKFLKDLSKSSLR